MRKQAEVYFRELRLTDLRAQSIRFAIAALAQKSSQFFPFRRTWEEQEMPDAWKKDLALAVGAAHAFLLGCSGNNKTEAAKKRISGGNFPQAAGTETN
jgi:hypothetical protein